MPVMLGTPVCIGAPMFWTLDAASRLLEQKPADATGFGGDLAVRENSHDGADLSSSSGV